MCMCPDRIFLNSFLLVGVRSSAEEQEEGFGSLPVRSVALSWLGAWLSPG